MFVVFGATLAVGSTHFYIGHHQSGEVRHYSAAVELPAFHLHIHKTPHQTVGVARDQKLKMNPKFGCKETDSVSD